MANLRNSVRLMGHLGQDPEVRNVGENKKLVRLSIATNESYKNDKGEKVTETQWHNLIAWGNVASIIENHCKKGNEISIEGKLQTNSYTDKDGIKRYSTEILIHDILLMGAKSEA